MNYKYLIGAVLSVPLLPLMYWQGKKIKAKIPKLPEAATPLGVCGKGRHFNLIMIGESTMAGVGVATHAEGFAGTLAQSLALCIDREVHWSVYARSGFTTAEMMAKLLPEIEEQQADLIVIGTGGNDAFRLTTPQQFGQDITELIHQIRQRFPTTPIVFPNMPPIKEFPAFTWLIKKTIGNLVELHGQELNQCIKTIPNTHYYADIITISGWERRLNVQNAPKAYFSDGVHPSALTYQLWARDLANWIVLKQVLLDDRSIEDKP